MELEIEIRNYKQNRNTTRNKKVTQFDSKLAFSKKTPLLSVGDCLSF